MKRILCTLFCLFILFALTSCQSTEINTDGTSITDSLGNTCTVSSDARVVSCYASFAECWLLSGGTLIGVTEDAVSDHGLDVGDAKTVGTVKHINLEILASLEPDYVILSSDLAAHLALKDTLDELGISYGYFREDSFEDYKSIMEKFCEVNQRPELYDKHVTHVEEKINEIKAKMTATDKTALLLRVYSTGMKAKADDNTAGRIISELGLINIADNNTALEDISLEYILKCDPDYIFTLTMGSEEGADAYLEETFNNNPIWQELSAVKNGNFHKLPKKLFHYKPNNRWGESYEYIATIIAPELF